ncbi:hypothetical protein [Microbulbifer halophilus]
MLFAYAKGITSSREIYGSVKTTSSARLSPVTQFRISPVSLTS